MLQPLVSIIINNYNYSTFLRQAIDSCLAQTYSPLEIVVVDDGSTDGSQEIILSYGDRLIPVLKPNGGQASAMNAGFQASHGSLILFLDADDYFYPDAVASIVAQWNPETAVLQSRLDSVGPEGQPIDLLPPPEIPFDTGDVRPLLLSKGRYNTTVTTGVSFSRRALEKVMPIPEADFRISADGHLVTTAPFYGSVQALEQPIGARRKHGANLWGSNSGLKVEQYRKSIRHDFLRYRSLAAVAAAEGLELAPAPGHRDRLHLIDRIVSLTLEPDQHPVAGDRRAILAWHGFWAIWCYSHLPQKRKVVLSLWFLWVGLMPRSLGKLAIAWMLDGSNRPQTIDRLLKKLRSATAA